MTPSTIGRINQYTCENCGGVITTIDRAEGVTPMLLVCRATPDCEAGTMTSAMYEVDQSLTPDYEWYLPSGDDFRRMSKPMQEHVNMGGLVLRKILTDAPVPSGNAAPTRRELKQERKLLSGQRNQMKKQLSTLRTQQLLVFDEGMSRNIATSLVALNRGIIQVETRLKQIKTLLEKPQEVS